MCQRLGQPSSTRNQVRMLIHLLLAEKDTSDDSCALRALFIRFSCHSRTNGPLLPPDDVSRLCAKLQYLMKLSVLELVSVESTEDARVEKMRSWLPLVEVNNSNIFSRKQTAWTCQILSWNSISTSLYCFNE